MARGALYANNGSLEKAISDFEEALKIDSEHRNAKKYLCETLIAQAQGHEDEDRFKEAKEVYNKILQLSPGYQDAVNGLRHLAEKTGKAMLKRVFLSAFTLCSRLA